VPVGPSVETGCRCGSSRAGVPKEFHGQLDVANDRKVQPGR
jgi:hypothetical protein